MKQIEVYSGNNCPWCVRAKALLESKGLDYEEINISTSGRAEEMVQRSGRRSMDTRAKGCNAVQGCAPNRSTRP